MINNRNQASVLLASQVDELERLYPGDIVRGYRDGFSGAPWPDKDPSPAYEHGRRNGVNDRGGTVDMEQRMLAADIVGKQRFERVMRENRILRAAKAPIVDEPMTAQEMMTAISAQGIEAGTGETPLPPPPERSADGTTGEKGR